MSYRFQFLCLRLQRRIGYVEPEARRLFIWVGLDIQLHRKLIETTNLLVTRSHRNTIVNTEALGRKLKGEGSSGITRKERTKNGCHCVQVRMQIGTSGRKTSSWFAQNLVKRNDVDNELSKLNFWGIIVSRLTDGIRGKTE